MEELPTEGDKETKMTMGRKRELKLMLTKLSSSESEITKAKKIKTTEINKTSVSPRALIEHETPEAIRQKLIEFYQKKDATASASCVTRSRAAARLELFELLDPFQPFPFDMLPVELRLEVFKSLPVEDKKSARLVSKDWKNMCTDYLKFIPVLKGVRTYDEITTSDSKFHEMTIDRFALKMDQRQPDSFVGGGNIQKLNFERSTVKVDNLKWLFTSCYNLEEIRIDYRRRWRYAQNFLSTKLPGSIPICQNLQRLDIWVGHNQHVYSWLGYPHGVNGMFNFDCESLESCKNLKYLNIRSLGAFNLKNCTKLPTSLRRLNVLVLLFNNAPANFHSRILESLIAQFQVIQTEDTSAKSLSKRTISIEDLIEVQIYFENCSTINFVSNDATEWDIFLDIIPGLMDEVYEPRYRKKPLNDQISSISNFSLIRNEKKTEG